jgi:hypothetical protein
VIVLEYPQHFTTENVALHEYDKSMRRL